MKMNEYGKQYPGSGTVNPYPGMFGSDKREAHEQKEQEAWESAGLIPSSDPDAGQSAEWIERRNYWANK